MNNLFSIFDPKIMWLNLSGNWLSSLVVILWFPSVYWLTKNQLLYIWANLVMYLAKEFKMNFSPINSPGHTHWALSLFVLILLNNIGGLTPYTFTSSSHLSFSVSLALVSWLGYMLFSLMLDTSSFLAHLVPLGTPYVLMPFMVLIELISNLIRPLTLSVRLAANLVAGHLLMTLISSPMVLNGWIPMMVLMTGLIFLLILESAVAFIQAYVFSMLGTLYLAEVNTKKFN